MKFTLTIDCDNAAFQPVHDDASEPERYEHALGEVLEILSELNANGLHGQRSGFLRDSNGNRCGQWSLSESED